GAPRRTSARAQRAMHCDSRYSVAEIDGVGEAINAFVWGGGRPRPPSRGVEPRPPVMTDRVARRSTRRAWRTRTSATPPLLTSLTNPLRRNEARERKRI